MLPSPTNSPAVTEALTDPPIATFTAPTHEELLKAVRNHYASQGYGLSIQRIRKRVNGVRNGPITQIRLLCDRGKARPSASKGLRQKPSSKINCPWRGILEEADQGWKYVPILSDNEHNHPAVEERGLRASPAIRRALHDPAVLGRVNAFASNDKVFKGVERVEQERLQRLQQLQPEGINITASQSDASVVGTRDTPDSLASSTQSAASGRVLSEWERSRPSDNHSTPRRPQRHAIHPRKKRKTNTDRQLELIAAQLSALTEAFRRQEAIQRLLAEEQIRSASLQLQLLPIDPPPLQQHPIQQFRGEQPGPSAPGAFVGYGSYHQQQGGF